MTTETTACPQCDSANLNKRKTVRPVFLCCNCRAEFDQPNVRPVRRRPNGGFENIDPDDYTQVRDALEQIHGPNSQYTTTKRVAEVVGHRPQYVGAMLKEIARPKGDVTAWNDAQRTLWRITIDEPREVADD
jgi:hypothetical protein